jgi:hypothetical protein
LLQSLSVSRPPQARTVPAWDLSLVLGMLNGDLFEPLASVEMKYLAYKTAFLLALASASRVSVYLRVSELHDIDVDTIQFGEGFRNVYYTSAPWFLTKTQSPEDTQRALTRITVESLGETLDDRMSDDKKLCPVRALRFYLEGTSQHRRTTKKLFVSTMAPYQGITTSTLSRWIVNTVKIYYTHASDGDCAHAQIRAHDIRGFATTWPFKNNVPLLEVMKAGTWKKHTTFTDFYLKDLTSLQNGLRSLGTLSVAQHKV